MSDVDQSRYEQLVQQRDMAEAYHAITSQMGPSAQLIAFINYDGNLGQELNIGLESLSVVEQHDLLLSALDIDQMNNAATEALVDNVRSAAKALKAASATSQGAYLRGGHASLGLVGNIGQLVARTALSATDHLVVQVEPYNEVATTYNDTLELFKLEEHIAHMLPSGFTEKDWVDFHKAVHPAIKKYNRNWISWGLAVPKDTVESYPVEWSEAGWTRTRYDFLVDKISILEREVDKLSARYAGHLEAIVFYLKNADRVRAEDRKEVKRTSAAINKLVVSTNSMFSRTYHRISWLKQALGDVKEGLEKS